MKRLFFLLILPFIFQALPATENQAGKKVLLAILARNKAHVLPTYLTCINNLTYDKQAMTVYINSNNNEDATREILQAWADAHKDDYSNILLDFHDVKGLGDDKPHEWTAQRFKVLAKIRNKSLQMAKEHGCDFYFVVDCDNFIIPCTLSELIKKDKPIIAPMLRSIPEPNDPFSNYFCAIDDNGYYRDHPTYMKILERKITGTYKVPVVHCTYLIKAEYLDKLSYIDNSDDYEFVIFSRIARQKGVGQYICNEKEFGTMIHFYSSYTLAQEAERVALIPSLLPEHYDYPE
ncbi:MAG: glycosyltransferase family 2 protein [Parachlamydia sp.]|nr:glycosyltransferase family 2 protein [Parachlamydia sp.]